MYAVVGVWDMDPAKAEMQRMGLEHVVAGVRTAPGLVQGYWTGGPGVERSHTFIVFEDAESAERFAADVRNNAAAQAMAGITLVSLSVSEVVATT